MTLHLVHPPSTTHDCPLTIPVSSDLDRGLRTHRAVVTDTAPPLDFAELAATLMRMPTEERRRSWVALTIDSVRHALNETGTIELGALALALVAARDGALPSAPCHADDVDGASGGGGGSGGVAHSGSGGGVYRASYPPRIDEYARACIRNMGDRESAILVEVMPVRSPGDTLLVRQKLRDMGYRVERSSTCGKKGTPYTIIQPMNPVHGPFNGAPMPHPSSDHVTEIEKRPGPLTRAGPRPKDAN